MTTRILIGDCRAEMAKLEPESVHCVVTSPPYWGLRDYGIEPGIWGGDPECAHGWGEDVPGDNRGGSGTPTDKNGRGEGYGRDATRGAFCTHCSAWRGTFGLEPTYQLYVEHSVEIFRAVKRILRADGTLWLNLGDSYTSNQSGGLSGSTLSKGGEQTTANRGFQKPRAELKNKDLCGIPWRVAFALQADGWYLRRDIIWHKPNPMPESTTDRCTTAHEYLFHFSKSEQYFYDADAIKEPAIGFSEHDLTGSGYAAPGQTRQNGNRLKGNARTFRGGGSYTQSQSFDNDGDIERESHGNEPNLSGTRNKRSVWTVSTKPFPEAHFATFPPDLIEPCILAGTSEHGCCPDCGAGWERITAQTRGSGSGSGRAGNPPNGKGGPNAQHAGTMDDIRMGPVITTSTLGFYPTCDCACLPAPPPYPDKPREDGHDTQALYEVAMVAWRADRAFVTSERTVLCARAKHHPVKPATVFDPFFGAGTTGLVAQRLKRNAIGCELNPEYAKMAQARLESDMMTRESGRRHMARALNKEKPWTAETLFAQNNTGDLDAGRTTGDPT